MPTDAVRSGCLPALALLAAMTFLAPNAGAAQTRTSECYLIRDARLVVRPGRVIEKGSVLVRNGRIEAVGEVAVPFDAEVIDGSSLTLYAGFIDAHSSLGLTPTKPEDDKGAVAPPNVTEDPLVAMEDAYRKGVHPEFRADVHFGLDLDGGKTLREAGFTAVLAVPEDGFISGESALVSLSGAPRRAALVVAKTAMHAALSAAGGGYPVTPMGAMAYLRQLFADAARYPQAWSFFRTHRLLAERPAIDATLEAMDPVMRGAMPIVFRADEYLGMQMAMRLCQEFGLRCMLDGAKSAYRIVDQLAQSETPLIVRLDWPPEPKREVPKKTEMKPAESAVATAAPGVKESQPVAIAAPKEGSPKEGSAKEDWTQPESTQMASPETESTKTEAPTTESPEPVPATAASTPPAIPEAIEPEALFNDRQRHYEESVKNLAVLEQHRVGFALTTAGCEAPKKFFDNLRAAVKAGLSEDTALAALTTTPARLFGAEDDLGSLEPGKLAHVVGFDANFLDEKATVRLVIVDGKKFEVKTKPKQSDAGHGDTKPAQVAGGWEVTVDSPQGSMTSTLTLEQSGGDLRGTMKSDFGEAKVRGSVDGNAVTLTLTLDMGGRSIELTLTGTLAADGMSGSVESPFGPSKFKAQRTPRS